MNNKALLDSFIRFVLSGLCVENITLGNVLFSNQRGEIVYDKRIDYWNNKVEIDLLRNIKIVDSSLLWN